MGAGAASGAAGAAGAASPALGLLNAVPMVAGGVMSLIEAGKQTAAKREADRVAEEAVARAKQELETEFLGAVQVPVEAYNQALKENTAQQMQALSALTEAGPRELAGGVGRVNEVANDQANTVTNQLADRLYNLDVAQANEKGQNASDIAKLYSARAEGAQEASMAAQMANIGLKNQALSSFGSAATSAVDALSPVYKKGNEELVSPVSKMQNVMIPSPKATVLDNTQLQGFASPEYQKMLQYMMNNTVNFR